MKRIAALLLALLMLVLVLPGCSSPKESAEVKADSPKESAEVKADSTKESAEVKDDSAKESTEVKDDSATVNLMDMYTVTDPEGVEYDQRIALYKPILESDDHYADGCRYMFSVLYGKEGKGVYMYSVEIYETEKQAADYQATTGTGEVDGVVYVVTSNADFFASMESFVPDLDTWINNLSESGMTEIE